MQYAVIFCFLIALILVIVKLLLEHQESEDRAKGIQCPHEEYTMKGVLKLIRKERKEKKTERKLSRKEQRVMEEAVPVVSVKPYEEPESTE